MTKSVIVPLADGFEEIEAVSVIDILRRGGVKVTTAGLHPGVAKGAHGIDIQPDTTLDTALDMKADMVVLPGGMPGAEHLRDDPRVMALLQRVHEQGGYACAICAAPMALGAAGLTAGRTVTSYPGFGDQFSHGPYVEDRVVVDGKVITSRGPGTATEFALTLLETLVGPQKAREVADGLLAVRSPAPRVV
jgi:4-methyl-5(b-hydroxyethyl)-thiazole monophosphate biosynthesis